MIVRYNIKDFQEYIYIINLKEYDNFDIISTTNGGMEDERKNLYRNRLEILLCLRGVH